MKMVARVFTASGVFLGRLTSVVSYQDNLAVVIYRDLGGEQMSCVRVEDIQIYSDETQWAYPVLR
jgi:hypothetical protein